jgi:hypothetical protein
VQPSRVSEPSKADDARCPRPDPSPAATSTALHPGSRLLGPGELGGLDGEAATYAARLSGHSSSSAVELEVDLASGVQFACSLICLVEVDDDVVAVGLHGCDGGKVPPPALYGVHDQIEESSKEGAEDQTVEGKQQTRGQRVDPAEEAEQPPDQGTG